MLKRILISFILPAHRIVFFIVIYLSQCKNLITIQKNKYQHKSKTVCRNTVFDFIHATTQLV